MKKYHLIYLALLLLSPLAGCSCEDTYDSEWNLEDDWPAEDAGMQDIFEEPDAIADAVDPDADAGGPDIADTMDATEVDGADGSEEPIEPWEPEEVEPNIPYNHALTDRTSLAVDPAGTLWLGYHSCNDLSCSTPMLRVTHKPVDGEWVGEDIDVHEGIFGVSVVKANEPIIAYPDSFDPIYRVKMRRGEDDWEAHDFPVPRSNDLIYDGFDVTQNGQSYFISFAPYNAPHVSLYTLDTDTRPGWEELRPLEIENSQAAMERGLRADSDGNAYLVNLSGETGIYGVYRYDKELDRWPQSVELQSYTDLFVHSLVVTGNFGLCMSGNYPSPEGDRLMITCGSMYDLTMDVKVFGDEPLSSDHPSSIVEGHDGTLYVAFNPPGNRELRVARRAPGAQQWQVGTVYDGPSYGVSTAIDLTGDLVISFYTCADDLCSLKVLWESPD